MNKSKLQMSTKQKEISQLLKLQELFHFHYLTGELLNEMILIYVRLVQKTSDFNHPLNLYFMQKIKFVLASPEIIQILQKETQTKNQSMRETIRGVIGIKEQQNQIVTRKLAQEAKQQMQINQRIKKDRQYDNKALGQQLKRKQCSLKIELQMKIMEEVEQNIQKITHQFHTAKQKREKKQHQISKIVIKQDQNLNQRLANRKKKLRKKSASFQQAQVVVVQEPIMIKKQQLLLVQKQLNQTYERFTRLTMGKTKLQINNRTKGNQGKIMMKIEQPSFQNDDFFNQISKEQAKIKSKVNKDDKLQVNEVEQKPLDQAKGRVTLRISQYGQIEEEQIF